MEFSANQENFSNFSKLISFKNKALFLPSEDVSKEENLQELYDKLSFNLKFYKGLGLSSVQIGILKKALVYVDSFDNIQFLANPEIIETSDEKLKMYEGCLSFPNATVLVERPRAVKIKYLNLDKEVISKEFFDRDARIVLHEIDHLIGQTFLDKISVLKRNLVKKKSEKFLKNPQYNIFFK